jgi:glycosyltransferase involved in cell wall biosynthesis
MLSPFGETQWLPGILDGVEAGRLLGYDGIWGRVKTVQTKLHKALPGLERNIMSAFRGDAFQRSVDITRRLLSKWRESDITVATHSFTAHAAALVSNRTRAFYHMQGYEPWFSDDRLFQSIAELSYKLPLIKIANCQWLIDKVGLLSRDDIKLVHPGLNHDVFYPRQEFSCKRIERAQKGQVKIVSYADPRPFKGWRESQEAMHRVFQSLNGEFDIDWTVFGSIDSGDIGLPVTYRGFLSHSQLAELYSEADVMFVPSWFESFPLQPIEAMSCGAAVVTTQIGTEDYARNEETALVVEPRDSEALAAAVIGLARCRVRRQRIAAGGMHEAQRFTWEQSTAEIKFALGL